MSTALEIESAIRKLPAAEARAVAEWLQDYLAHQITDTAPNSLNHAVAKWRGRGRLPAGRNTDDYLRLTRDGSGN